MSLAPGFYSKTVSSMYGFKKSKKYLNFLCVISFRWIIRYFLIYHKTYPTRTFSSCGSECNLWLNSADPRYFCWSIPYIIFVNKGFVCINRYSTREKTKFWLNVYPSLLDIAMRSYKVRAPPKSMTH